MMRKPTFLTIPAAARAALSKLLGAALVSAAAVIAPAQAGIIDFEGQFGPVSGAESLQQGDYTLAFYANTADGGIGSLVGSYIDGSDPSACVGMACPVNNPSTYYAALNDGYIDLFSSSSSGLFSIKSFDASFIGGSPILSSYPVTSGLLRIQAFQADGTYMLADFALGGPGVDGFEFGHFLTPAAFANTAFVEALLFGFVCNSAGNCSAFSSDRAQFGLDNLELVAVPEPSSQLMVGLGLLGMIACVRRRQA